MAINKEIHPKSDVDRLFVARSKGSRGLKGGKLCVITDENSLGRPWMNNADPLLMAVRVSSILPNCIKLMKPMKFKKLKQNERISNWNDKKMHGQGLSCDVNQHQFVVCYLLN